MSIFIKTPVVSKPDVGSVRTCFTKLPPGDHAYGVLSTPIPTKENAGTVIFDYKYENEPGTKLPEVLDFKKINKIKLRGNFTKSVSIFCPRLCLFRT